MARSKRKSKKKAEEVVVSAKKGRQTESITSDIDNTGFDQLVANAGIFLKNSDDSQDEIGVDVPIFQKRLTAAIKSHQNYPKVIEEFVESLQKRSETPERFRLSLLPILVAEESEGSIHGHNQESLIRILLGIDLLQPRIANMLLEKLPELMGDENGHGSNNGETNTARLIMNQFRWLDRIVNSKELTEKMLEMVSITSPDVQHEIITCLPEVVDDTEHTGVALQLRELLLQNTSLAVPILYALSNLNLRQDLLAEVRVSVLQMLPSAELDDLPVVTKFILQSVSDNDAFEVISELRMNLDFGSLIPQSSSTPLNPRQEGASASADKDGELLTLDAIRSGIRFQKSVAEGWLKAIESVNSAALHKVIDLFVLLILHSTGNRKKTVESLFRNKIKVGHFTEEMLSSAFNSHNQILREYFSNLLSLGEVLLRSPETSVSSYACAIYRLAFASFDLYCKQEIVGALVTHIGSGFATEADSSLDVLSDLVETHPKIMAPFAVFIKGILDYLDNLTLSQIRKVFSMLSTLAFSSPRDGAMIQDDVHIVIRKQLSSSCPKYKRIGIIGAVMIVRSMARKRSDDDNAATSSQFFSSISNDIYKQIVNLLDMVRSSVARVPEAAALFYDELTRVIEQGDVDRKIKNWISETVVSDFQEDFLVDRDAPLPKDTLPIEFVYGLDEAEEGSIALNILPLLLTAAAATSKPQSVLDKPPVASLVCLAPHFRLLRICEQSQHNGDLEGIDALLGCPLITFKFDMLEEINTLAQADREVMCKALFYTVNWFIELINGFATQGDPEMKGKTLTRLNDITCLYKQIETSLTATPTFTPSLATFDGESPAPVVLQTATKGKRSRKASKGNETKKLDETIEKLADKENDKDLDSSSVSVVEKDKRKDKASSFSMSQCRPYLRWMLLANNDGIMDGPGCNTEEASIMNQCYHLLFSCLQTFFSWSGFLSSENQGLLKKALTVLSSRTKLSNLTQSGLQELLKQSFHYLEQFSNTMIDMATALTLTKLLVVLSERLDNQEINKAIAKLTGGFLKREWIKSNGEKDSGPKYNEALQYLLRFNFSFSEDPLAAIEEITAGAFTELMEDDTCAASESYPTLTRSTVPSFYRAVFEELIAYLKQTHGVPLKRTDVEQANERLTQLNIIVREFHILINLVKAFDQRQVLASALKLGRIFVETFLKLGMPLLDQTLRTNKDVVHGLLKNLQQSTRCLQHFCGHTKVFKDIALTNHVPAVKKCLELFVFRVKVMLTVNQCHEAFWMGNLKNRDIQGQEILSQQSTRGDEDNDNDDDDDKQNEDQEMEVVNDNDEDDDDDEDEKNEAESVVSHDSGGGDDDEDSCSDSF
ncbi:Fanconi anemia group D2 protein-like [Actinia tenebrosa]|uniref:Fanconi anemia group D2 protein-like n=1 Tax=Actinia tenebrosa TaxID=6105 RepID=A0A6P8ICE2_ACTTE|nr:Fanconi anemia group D2 protein-like [Actinia tenebrosa]